VEEGGPFANYPSEREMSFGSFDGLSEASANAPHSGRPKPSPRGLANALPSLRHSAHPTSREPRKVHSETLAAPPEVQGRENLHAQAPAGETLRESRQLERSAPLPPQPRLPTARVETSTAAAKAAIYRQQTSKIIPGGPAR
jgi:hypothetical protein